MELSGQLQAPAAVFQIHMLTTHMILLDNPGEERRMRVYDNRMWRRIYAPKRKEVTGGWKESQNEW